jgi:hypothetical protein
MNHEDELVQASIEVGALRARLQLAEARLAALRNGKPTALAPSPAPGPAPDQNEPPAGHTQAILAHFAQHPAKVKIQKLATILQIPSDRMKAFRSTITRLAKEKKIVRHGRGQYKGATMA